MIHHNKTLVILYQDEGSIAIIQRTIDLVQWVPQVKINAHYIVSEHNDTDKLLLLVSSVTLIHIKFSIE